MEDLYQIYLVTNLINNKKYVGQAVKNEHRNYLTRWKEHIPTKCWKHIDRFASAIKHYGPENFKVELIEDNIPLSLIDEKEIYYINYYNTFYKNGFGYNMTLGGQGVHGYKHTEETKEKISASSINKWENWKKDEEFLLNRNKKISDKLKGRQFSEEHRNKLSEYAKTRTGEKNPFYGKHHSDELKQHLAIIRGLPINMCDKKTGEIIKTFNSAIAAARYLVEMGYTENEGCYSRILSVIRGKPNAGKTAYGFKWEFVK